jgi:hypothetical protein
MQVALAQRPNLPILLLGLSVCGAAAVILVGRAGPEWLVPFLMGSWLVLHGTARLQLAASAASWERTAARVIFRGTAEVWDGYARYRPVVRFEAVVNGRRIRSARFSLHPEDFEGDQADEAENLLRPYPEGSEILVFRDPRPGRELVVRVDLSEKRINHYRTCIAGGYVLMAVALFLGCYVAP